MSVLLLFLSVKSLIKFLSFDQMKHINPEFEIEDLETLIVTFFSCKIQYNVEYGVC